MWFEQEWSKVFPGLSGRTAPMIGSIRNWLIDSTVAHYDVDSPEFSIAHRQDSASKTYLARVVRRSFTASGSAMDLRYFRDCPGRRLEIGSGAGINSRSLSQCNYERSQGAAICGYSLVSRKASPLLTTACAAIYGINVFHHLSRPRDFFGRYSGC